MDQRSPNRLMLKKSRKRPPNCSGDLMTASNAGTVEFKRASTMFPLHPLATALALLMVSWQLDSLRKRIRCKQTNCSRRRAFSVASKFQVPRQWQLDAQGSPQSGGLILFSYSANITLKLMLIRCRSLRFALTECGSQAGNRSSMPSATDTTT